MHRSFNMSIAALWIALLLVLSGGNSVARAFSTHQQRQHCHPSSSSSSRHQNNNIQSGRTQCSPSRHSSSTSLSVIGAGAASLLAGSVGGAIGVGVAYPLDTLKTKAQVYSQQQSQQRKLQMEQLQQQQQQIQEVNAMPQIMDNSTGAIPLGPPGTVCDRDDCYVIENPEDDLISLVNTILEVEGISGFFGGVKAMMIGQALIKSVAFSANTMALGVLNDFHLLGVVNSVGSSGADGGGGGEEVATSFVTLILAASFSGFVTSFLVAPVGEFSLFCFFYLYYSFFSHFC